MGWVEKFANRILDLGGVIKIEATPETKVYDDMKAYLIDEDEDLQETNQDLELIELIGVQNWLVQKLNGTTAAE